MTQATPHSTGDSDTLEVQSLDGSIPAKMQQLIEGTVAGMFNRTYVGVIIQERAEATCDVCVQRLPTSLVRRPDGWMLVCTECRHEAEDSLGARVYPASLWFEIVTPAIIKLSRLLKGAS